MRATLRRFAPIPFLVAAGLFLAGCPGTITFPEINLPSLIQGQENTPPTAGAGLDIRVNIGDRVSLSGHTSNDVDGDPLTFTWESSSGPVTVDIHDADQEQAWFVATTAGNYAFVLTVDDGSSSDQDAVRVFVAEADPNHAVDSHDPTTTTIRTIPTVIPAIRTTRMTPTTPTTRTITWTPTTMSTRTITWTPTTMSTRTITRTPTTTSTRTIQSIRTSPTTPSTPTLPTIRTRAAIGRSKAPGPGSSTRPSTSRYTAISSTPKRKTLICNSSSMVSPSRTSTVTVRVTRSAAKAN